MLQLQTMNRDFNENDYDVLSQLDNYNTSQATERMQVLISRLPIYQYQAKADSRVDEPPVKDFNMHSCSICIESFQDDESIKILPCFHQFHSKCVDDWLLRKSICPVCKFDIESSNSEE